MKTKYSETAFGQYIFLVLWME